MKQINQQPKLDHDLNFFPLFYHWKCSNLLHKLLLIHRWTAVHLLFPRYWHCPSVISLELYAGSDQLTTSTSVFWASMHKRFWPSPASCSCPSFLDSPCHLHKSLLYSDKPRNPYKKKGDMGERTRWTHTHGRGLGGWHTEKNPINPNKHLSPEN